MTIVLHATPSSPRAFRCLCVAEHLGVTYRLQPVNLIAGEQRTPAFAALNPNRRMPVLVDGDFVLWESNAILEYLAAQKPEAGLLPTDVRGRLAVTKWLYWSYSDWDSAFFPVVYERFVKPLMGLAPDDSVVAAAQTRIAKAARILDDGLGRQPYIAGPDLTLADFALASPLIHAGRTGVSLQRYPHIARWYERLETLPAWQRTLALVAAAMRRS